MMESYSDMSKDSSYSYSSNSSTYDHYQRETKSRKPPPAFRSALHSVRKNIITKKPIAPLPPTPPKIYKVGPFEFKEVVQKLTGAPDFQQTRLQEVAPPPLSLSQPRKPVESTFGTLSPLGFSLSPASLAWCSSMLLSPGTLATFEPSVVL
ncbi:hypothetical protein ACS0TY_006272 [Phlomoides rotata]